MTLDKRNQRRDSDVSMILRLGLGLSFIFVAVLIGLHQYITIGQFFQLRDALHHEFFIAFIGGFGLGILADTLLAS